MMADKTVYRSTHPDVMAAWRTAQEQAIEIGRQRRELLDSLGFVGIRALTTDTHILGVEHLAGEIPAGWRRDRQTSMAIVPNRRTKAGAEVGRQLDRLTMPDPRLILIGGMPHMVWPDDEVRTYWPGRRLLDGAVWVTWGCDPEKSGRTVTIDPEVWQRMKLSEYYAAVEAAEEVADRG